MERKGDSVFSNDILCDNCSSRRQDNYKRLS